MSESVERSTERHHASITAADVKRDAAERFLRDDYAGALQALLRGRNENVWSPAFLTTQIPVVALVLDDVVSESQCALVAELLAIAYACAIASGELETRDVRAKAVALITRLEDEHVSTHLDAAAEE